MRVSAYFMCYGSTMRVSVYFMCFGSTHNAGISIVGGYLVEGLEQGGGLGRMEKDVQSSQACYQLL